MIAAIYARKSREQNGVAETPSSLNRRFRPRQPRETLGPLPRAKQTTIIDSAAASEA